MISFLEYHKRASEVEKTECSVLNRGGLKAYLVDAEKIRDMSLHDEEFTNYAIHDDFPKMIPKGEIWISNLSNDPEREYYVDEALKRIYYSRTGMNSKQAYEKAIEWSKEHRGKIEQDYIYEKDGEVHKRKLGTIGKFNIYSVDARLVRDLYKVDYVEGGHGYVYDFIPKDEIWIEDEIKRGEIEYIVKHEYTELKLMRDKKMSYEKAHREAAKAEYEDRKKKESEAT